MSFPCRSRERLGINKYEIFTLIDTFNLSSGIVNVTIPSNISLVHICKYISVVVHSKSNSIDTLFSCYIVSNHCHSINTASSTVWRGVATIYFIKVIHFHSQVGNGSPRRGQTYGNGIVAVFKRRF